MNPFPRLRALGAGLLLTLGILSVASADSSDLLFTVRIEGNTNTPTIYVTNNSSTLEISRFELTIGDTTKHFHAQGQTAVGPPNFSATVVSPAAGGRDDLLAINLTNFGPGKTFAIQVDVDRDTAPQDTVEDYRKVFFNNGGAPNAVAKVFAGAAASATRTLTDINNPPDPVVFRGPGRKLELISRTKDQGLHIQGVEASNDGIPLAVNPDGPTTLEVAHGDRIQITAPGEVFRNIHSEYISDPTPDKVLSDAEERFVASGMSVNNIAQTGDPTHYVFEITNDTVVEVKWDHHYALTIRQDFSKTQSQELVEGKPWAGPLASDATGNPSPPVSKQWVPRGTQPVVQVDGFFVDSFSHPGLDLRYVVKGYRAYGPPNHLKPKSDSDARIHGADIRTIKEGAVASYGEVTSNGAPLPNVTEIATIDNHNLVTGDRVEISGSSIAAYNGTHTVTKIDDKTFRIPVQFTGLPATRGTWKTIYVDYIAFPTIEQRQQVKPAFPMYGPGGITYVWQIQYGVRVNVDDVSRTSLAKVYEITPGNGQINRTIQDGVAWFDPGSRVKVVAAAKEPVQNGLSLTGWVNGDGYYFSSIGQIDPANGQPTSGGPVSVNGSPVATWISGGSELELGYQISNLQRPVRTLWRYGAGAIAVTVDIGKHVFEDRPDLAELFVRKPEPITNAVPDPDAIGPDGVQPGAELMAEWDPGNSRLYPTIPGRFTIPWKPGLDSENAVDVRVTARLPHDAGRNISGHYPHINGTPEVALDPDPNDDFSFKSLKYTTAGATVDGKGHFVTTRPGFSVLLFSQIQRVGRGQPREFLQVRVVHTRDWKVGLPTSPASREIGSKILDPAADAAGLGTGFVFNAGRNPRYNPFIYDASKLEGLAARNIYDMERLRADDSSLVVLNKEALPGPVIPVNENPGAVDDDLPVIVWYDDPRRNDTIMWPAVARVYRPAWPTANLPRIVIASQYGSDGLSKDGKDQQVSPAIGEIPPATTYDPSRFQSVQIYNQPDRNAPGFNPNEEHALIAPSLRFASVSPRPPAVYALRDGDLNDKSQTSGYTSHPYVLVQFFDTVAGEMKMNVYTVSRVSGETDDVHYKFASIPATPSQAGLKNQPFVKMWAGEPVIPFYPLGEAIGASPPPQTFGENHLGQTTYWEDWRGSSWAISGGDNAWFSVSFYYPLAPEFWWPENRKILRVKLPEGGKNGPVVLDSRAPVVPAVGDAIAFLPEKVSDVSIDFPKTLPVKVLYKAEWPENPPVLKAGETLTFSGGEFRADNPTRTVVRDGVAETVETPGLPQLTAFASAEVVFDSLNSLAESGKYPTHWTGRVIQALDKRTAPLPANDFPPELQPAGGGTTAKQGKYVFNGLSASLQRRLRYDPVNGVLEFSGLLNDKDIGDPTLTASPPAVYSLEPNILTAAEKDEILALVKDTVAKSKWSAAVNALYSATRNPEQLDRTEGYLVGLMKLPAYNDDGSIKKDALGNVVYVDTKTPTPLRAFGPGLALVPNSNFLDPTSSYPDESWVTVVENNDPSLGGSPITPHIIKVDRRHRYRGSIQTLLSDNVFDENIVLRSTGDFGANAEELIFEWWYRPDDGSQNVPPPDLIRPGQPNPWKLFPDPSGNGGANRYQMTLTGSPNAPEALLADTWWFLRYRHKKDPASGTNWGSVNFTWAGAGNSQPFVDADLDGIPDYRAQLAQGWIKRVLDAVNPYEARIRDFEGDSPSTVSSMISQFGARYEGPVALNPAKNVIENVGLIELYETILNRGRSLSVDLSRPVSTPAIANALQLASTRISDFYTLLANEAYGDALDPTIGHGSGSVDYGSLSTSVHAFQNQMSSDIEEELALLRGVDDHFARPVYNRLFWNFTKGEGEAAYATNYNITDVNADGFIDEDDAMLLFPQGHGDAWGHYLTALRNQYELLRHPYFNWVSRSESYNLQDIVITVDFLDERKFAATAAAKAKTASEIVDLTYRERYVADPNAQWQGYTDSNADRAWGVDEWGRRSGQGAYFDWVTANALLPSTHPNTTLEGIRKVDRESNPDIPVISANLNSIQRTVDRADRGYNPLGLVRGAQLFDLDPMFEYFGEYGGGTRGKLHFDQIQERAEEMLESATTVWDRANEDAQMIRQIGASEAEFRSATFEEDLAYRNRLIQIFGKPYEGTIGPGRLYPAGYEGPDLALYMYVPVREINKDTVPGPASSFAGFSDTGALSKGDLYNAFLADKPSGSGDSILNKETALDDVSEEIRKLFSPTFASASNTLTYGASTKSGLFAVNYTDLQDSKVELDRLKELMPVTAAGYTFQAPKTWGARGATGELQDVINQMIQQEAEVAKAIGAWDALTGESVRILRLINAKLTTSGRNQGRDEVFSRVKLGVNDLIKVIETAHQVVKASRELTWELKEAIVEGVPVTLPTGGLAISPGDALSLARSGIEFTAVGTRSGLLTFENVLSIGKLVAEISLDIAENELNIAKADESRTLEIKEWIKELEDKIGDEPVLRIAIFKEMEALRALSDRYRTLLDEGARLIDERAAFNKRVAAQTQLNRYQDMTFRVARNHALQTYRSSFDLAARYSYLAASAYDYETNYSPTDPASPSSTYGEIIRARSLGALDRAMTKLKQNYESQRGSLGLNNPQRETGEISLRREYFRILSSGESQPDGPVNEFPAPGEDSDSVWKRELQSARVPDLWQLAEFRNHCRPFAAATNAAGRPVPQPGIVIRFSSDISSGKNFFGKPLSGGDQAYSTSNYATKIVGVGVAFEGYQTDDVINDLAAAPRIYFVPAGMDIMRVSRSDDPDERRMWKVVEQAIPVPFPATGSQLQKSGYIPLIDGLNGRLGDRRLFSDFRAYPEELGDAVKDTRLVGRSIWNTQWILIIPGATLNADPETGLDRFVDQVTDIKLIFDTYGQSGG